jgi:hypothetical protein
MQINQYLLKQGGIYILGCINEILVTEYHKVRKFTKILIIIKSLIL